MSRQWKKPESEEDERPKSEPGMCLCYGCPMPGSVSKSTTKSDDWLCSVHAHVEPQHWPIVSDRLSNQLRTHVSLLLDLRRALNRKQVDLRGWLITLKTNGMETLLPGPDETRGDGSMSLRMWAARVDKELIAAAIYGLDTSPAQTQPTGNVERLMEMVKEWLVQHQA